MTEFERELMSAAQTIAEEMTAIRVALQTLSHSVRNERNTDGTVVGQLVRIADHMNEVR